MSNCPLKIILCLIWLTLFMTCSVTGLSDLTYEIMKINFTVFQLAATEGMNNIIYPTFSTHIIIKFINL